MGPAFMVLMQYLKAQNPELVIYFAACFIFRKLFLFDFEQSQHIVEQLQQFNIIPRIS